MFNIAYDRFGRGSPLHGSYYAGTAERDCAGQRPDPAPTPDGRPRQHRALPTESPAHRIDRIRDGSNRFVQRKLDGFDLRALGDFAGADSPAFRDLPFTTKQEFIEDQLEHPPYGTNLSNPLRDYVRLHQTSGTTGAPLTILDTTESWDWWADCWTVIYHAAGVGQRGHCLSGVLLWPVHRLLVGVRGRQADRRAGGSRRWPVLRSSACSYDPGNRRHGAICTPTYALHLAEVAAPRASISLPQSCASPSTPASRAPRFPVPGGASRRPGSTRAYDHIGMTEMGAYAFTCLNQDAVHINEAEFIAEILDPATG